MESCEICSPNFSAGTPASGSSSICCSDNAAIALAVKLAAVTGRLTWGQAQYCAGIGSGAVAGDDG